MIELFLGSPMELQVLLSSFLILIVWSLYGVAATFSPNLKNVSYNLLDLVSKNFYGLYIYYEILKLNN